MGGRLGMKERVMSKRSEAKTPNAAQVRAELQEVVALLRRTRHLDPSAQRNLADAVDELSRAIQPDALPSAETIHLAQTLAELARNLHGKEDKGPLTAVGERLRAAVTRVEAKSPFVAGLVQRLLDALAGIGI